MRGFTLTELAATIPLTLVLIVVTADIGLMAWREFGHGQRVTDLKLAARACANRVFARAHTAGGGRITRDNHGLDLGAEQLRWEGARLVLHTAGKTADLLPARVTVEDFAVIRSDTGLLLTLELRDRSGLRFRATYSDPPPGGPR